ncbi:MAG: GNAT family N-acetyltransferase [Flavobacteriaceae bacterium]|nr:GNAT family N-acetyltransferase [Flavobacteriaceae bacterium]
MNNINLRYVKPNEMDQLVDLCEAHAIFERAEFTKEGKSKKLLNDLFSKSPELFCLVLESKNELLGYMSFMKQYSTWHASNYIYMDCLFLKDKIRGKGFGEKLMKKLQEESKSLNCDFIQWQTPDFNKRAIKFYKRMGGISLNKKRFFLY